MVGYMRHPQSSGPQEQPWSTIVQFHRNDLAGWLTPQASSYLAVWSCTTMVGPIWPVHCMSKSKPRRKGTPCLAADMAIALPSTSHLHTSQPSGEIASLYSVKSSLTRMRQTETPAQSFQTERPTAARWTRWSIVWPGVGKSPEGVRQMFCVPSGVTQFGVIRQIECVRRAPTPRDVVCPRRAGRWTPRCAGSGRRWRCCRSPPARGAPPRGREISARAAPPPSRLHWGAARSRTRALRVAVRT